MTECDRCGASTRTVYPYVRKSAARVSFMAQDSRLSRLALYALDPAAEASIPWGEHHGDDDIGVACGDCAKAMALVPTDS